MIRKHFFIATLLLLTLVAEGVNAEQWVTVKRVADGDTVQLSDGRSVRYIGVNAPEINHERNTAEPFGFEARKRNIELVGTQRIRLEFDIEHFDDYGRTLAYLFLPDGSMVNEKLLQSGMAHCLYKMPNIKYEARLLKAQREAMQGRRGMWGEWREEGGRYVGNRNSRRFHRSSCPEVKRIYPKNRIVFSKRWDAFWAGYAPARECQKITADRDDRP
ncbi:MAG TPA: thermonuclease family protein [Desulfobacterales bacterium]|nr:thermonuclease family protein [Desulfobacterales bacterium]